MILGYGLNEVLTDADNIYDLIGNCFGVLCENIDNHQAFISRYLDRELNPNFDILNRFSEDVMDAVDDYDFINYVHVKHRIFGLVDKLELQDYLEPKENQLAVIYCILTAIDSVAGDWEEKWALDSLGPLDQHHKTGYRVYYVLKKTIHADYMGKAGRERTVSSDFFEQFENFRFVNENRWKEHIDVPKIKYLQLKRSWKSKGNDIYRLKIAVVPVSCEENFEFRFVGESRYVVDYSKCDQAHLAKKVGQAVEAAIYKECNIIVLPEYVVSQEVYRSVQKQIRKCHRELKEKMALVLVFAGSTWTEDGNNVMRILDDWGEEVGEYYKYSPYVEFPKGKHRFECCEVLSAPGRCCDIIAIENVGLFLPAICRDVIDGEYTEKLAHYLLPAFTIIAAWSPSLAQFAERQREMANKYFVSSILANACSSIRKRALKIGNGAIICKRGTITQICKKDIKRKSCMENCSKEGCLYLLEYDFSYEEKEKNTDIEILRYDIE